MIILLGSVYKENKFAFDIKASYFALKEDSDIKAILKNIITVYTLFVTKLCGIV